MTDKTTVVLVHGAFADAGSFADVTAILLAAGVPVFAPSNPLRSLTGDAAYIASVLAQIEGPVLLVGHSYAGAVITNAARGAANVKGLVYVAAFIPDENEKLSDVTPTSKDSTLGPALVPRTFPGGAGPELYVSLASFHEVFAHDLPAERAAVLAASQRPIAGAAFEDPTGVPAWKTLPTWAIIASGDHAAGADVTRSMAQRAGAEITELDGSHVIMISRPQDVADVILTALATV
jgi:pimeloyl-ACP methyl ester carboxylesterase